MSSPPVALRIRFPFRTEDEFLARYGSNLGRGGMFVATRALKPEGTEVAFELVLAGGERLVAGEGVVVKSQVDAGGGRAGMTVRFTRLDPVGKQLIERAVQLRFGPPRTAAPEASAGVPTPVERFTPPFTSEEASSIGEPPSEPAAPEAAPWSEAAAGAESASDPQSTAPQQWPGAEETNATSAQWSEADAAEPNAPDPQSAAPQQWPGAEETNATSAQWSEGAEPNTRELQSTAPQQWPSAEESSATRASWSEAVASAEPSATDLQSAAPQKWPQGEETNATTSQWSEAASALETTAPEPQSTAPQQWPGAEETNATSAQWSEGAEPNTRELQSTAPQQWPGTEETNATSSQWSEAASALEMTAPEPQSTAPQQWPSAEESNATTASWSETAASAEQNAADPQSAAPQQWPHADESSATAAPWSEATASAEPSAPDPQSAAPQQWPQAEESSETSPWSESPTTGEPSAFETTTPVEAPPVAATTADTSASDASPGNPNAEGASAASKPNDSIIAAETNSSEAQEAAAPTVPPSLEPPPRPELTPLPQAVESRAPESPRFEERRAEARERLAAVLSREQPAAVALKTPDPWGAVLADAPLYAGWNDRAEARNAPSLDQLCAELRAHGEARAVFAVPARLGARRREALGRFLEGAQVRVLRLVARTSALALAFATGQNLARQRVLLLDFDHDALEVALGVVTGDDVEVLSLESAPAAGTSALDSAIANELARGFGLAVDGSMLREIRRAREALGQSDPVELSLGGAPVRLTRDTVLHALVPWLQAVRETVSAVLTRAKTEATALDARIAAGQPLEHEWLRAAIEPLLRGELRVFPPGELARGAAALAHALEERARGKRTGNVSELLGAPVFLLSKTGMVSVLEPGTRLPAERTLALRSAGSQSIAVHLFDHSAPDPERWIGGTMLELRERGELSLHVLVDPSGGVRLEARVPAGERRSYELARVRDFSADVAIAPELESGNAPVIESSRWSGLKRLFGKR
jgi:molecular chaperone DnaK